MNRVALPLALLCAAAAAKPPVVPDYARMGELESHFNDVFVELKAKEEFARKSLQEQLVIKLGDGVKSWGPIKNLTGEAVVKEIFEKWKAAQVAENPPQEVVDTLALLPKVLKKLYDRMPIPKEERFKATDPLVDALLSDYPHLRQAAIDCLWEIYN
jgi:hypothetical protein